MEPGIIAAIAALVLFVVVVLVWALFLSQPKPFLRKGDPPKAAKIIDIKELSHDTKRYRLDLGSEKTPLGLPIGQHLSIEAPNPNLGKGTWNGATDIEKKDVIVRKYTPTPTDSSNVGYCDLVIKTYRPGTVKMPDGSEKTWENGGRMGLYMDSLKIGDSIKISGPIGLHEYYGRGKFKGGGKVHEVKSVGMMAGGTGITPMLQIANAVIQDKNDNTKMSLIYANKTEDDILCRDIIDDLVEKSKGQLKVIYTLDFPPEGWKGKSGFISEDMIEQLVKTNDFPSHSNKPLILMCGPPPMVQGQHKNLEALGYAKDMRIQF